MLNRITRLLLSLLVLNSSVSPVCATEISEHQIKAVFLFNFANFIRWSDSAFADSTSPFRFCSLNDKSKTISILKKVIADEKIKGRPLSFHHAKGPNDIKECQILFVQAGHQTQYIDILNKAAGHQILTVSDDPNFTNHGGMIALTQQGRRLRPTINISHLEKTGLKVSAKLLRIAIVVSQP